MALLFKNKELEQLKRDVAIIKHILSEEGKLNPRTRRALEQARQTPENEYISHKELKKRILR